MTSTTFPLILIGVQLGLLIFNITLLVLIRRNQKKSKIMHKRFLDEIFYSLEENNLKTTKVNITGEDGQDGDDL